MFAAPANPASLLQMGGLLLLGVLMIAWAKNQRSKMPREVRSVRLTPEHAVHLVRVGQRRLVIGTGRGQAPALLADLPGELMTTQVEEHDTQPMRALGQE